MFLRSLILLLTLFFGLSVSHANQDTETTSPNTILILGDSLSAAHNIPLKTGWANLLQNHLQQHHAQWRVVNASISGETTSGGLARLPSLLTQHQPDICIIELGANDGLRGQSIKNMRMNLSSMVELCQKQAKVLLLGIWLPPNYGKKYTDLFKQSYQEIAAQYAIPLNPFFLEGVAGDDTLMQSDGLHPTADAQPKILQNVLPFITPLLQSKDG